MDGAPSTAAWVALVVLVVLHGSAALVEHRRDRGARQQPIAYRNPDGGSPLPDWAMTAAAAIAALPLVISLIAGAPIMTIAWWLLIGPTATGVLLGVVGTAAVIAARWPQWRNGATAQERPTVYLVVVISVLAAVAIPAVGVTAVVVDGDVPLAAALALTCGYVLWRTALAVTRRSPHLGATRS